MQKINNKLIIITILALLILSAFGCKEEAAVEENTEANTETNETAENVVPPVDTNAEFPIVNADETNDETNEMEIPVNEEEAVNEVANETENAAEEVENIETEGQEEVEQTEEVTVMALGEKIAEIYGTYTNKDKEAFKNYKTLKTYATNKMDKWLDAQIDQSVDQDAPFYGVTTKSISSAVTNAKDNKMTVMVTTKREEITATSNKPTVKYEIIRLEFVKEKKEWKLDGAYWLN